MLVTWIWESIHPSIWLPTLTYRWKGGNKRNSLTIPTVKEFLLQTKVLRNGSANTHTTDTMLHMQMLCTHEVRNKTWIILKISIMKWIVKVFNVAYNFKKCLDFDTVYVSVTFL
jgi:hypothetical protein